MQIAKFVLVWKKFIEKEVNNFDLVGGEGWVKSGGVMTGGGEGVNKHNNCQGLILQRKLDLS